MMGENEVWVVSVVHGSDLIAQLVARTSAEVRDKAVKWYAANAGVAAVVDPAERHNVFDKIEKHLKGDIGVYISAYPLEPACTTF
jgi:hypothetical protein